MDMSSLAKIGLITVGGSSVIPITIVSSRNSGYILFEEIYNSEYVPAKVNNAHSFLTKVGYSEKKSDKLVDFNAGREARQGGNFALGCHRVLFGGKNVLRLKDTSSTKGDGWSEDAPLDDYFGDKDKPLLGCSTAAVMKGDKKIEKVYEFELALRRGDKGFLERVSVWKEGGKAISQLLLYERNNDPATQKQHPYRVRFGIQRTITGKTFKIGNPEATENKWSNLELDKETINKPKHFSVWVGDSKGQTTNNKNMLEGLGVRFDQSGSENKLFSSIAKTSDETEWEFRFFGRDHNAFHPNTSPHNHKIKTKYTSKIADEIENSKGVWKEIKEFCKSQESAKKGQMNEEDIYRLRDYCYTLQNKS